MTKKRTARAAANEQRVVINIWGGLVSDVYTDAKLDVVVVDHDNEEQGDNAAHGVETTPLKDMDEATAAKVKEYDA